MTQDSATNLNLKSNLITAMRLQERKVLRENKELVVSLLEIPHLEIDIPIDIEKIKAEASLMKQTFPHKLHENKGLSEAYYRHHEWSFRGQCFYDYQKDSEQGMIDAKTYLFNEDNAQFNDSGRLNYSPTLFGQQTPQTIKTLKQISPYINRSRFISTEPNGGIPWHSHHNGIYSTWYPRLAILHVPLESNPKAIHSVRSFEDKESRTYEEYYKVGKAYLFNSWHDHQFWNKGSHKRLTVISYFNFCDPDFLEFLRPLVSSYRGPRIKQSFTPEWLLEEF